MKKKWKKKSILPMILILVVIVLIILFFVGRKFLEPSISLVGEKEITIDLEENYQEKGVKANCFGKDISREVQIEGTVDTSQEGTYILTYQIHKYGMKKEVKRTVIVKDMDPPTLTLKGEKEVSVCNLSSYQEAGYEAKDNKDGDLTEKVKVTKEDEKIIYEVSDSNGNTTTETRYLKVEDTKKPLRL